jgi:hypothetical protein
MFAFKTVIYGSKPTFFKLRLKNGTFLSATGVSEQTLYTEFSQRASNR